LDEEAIISSPSLCSEINLRIACSRHRPTCIWI